MGAEMFSQDRVVRFTYFAVNKLEVLGEDKPEDSEGTFKRIMRVVDATVVVGKFGIEM